MINSWRNNAGVRVLTKEHYILMVQVDQVK